MAAEKSKAAPKKPSTTVAKAGDTPIPAKQTEANPVDKKPRDMPTSAPVAGAGPVAVHVESGDVKVVVAPPAPAGLDRRLFRLSNGLPHNSTSDRYVSVLSDLGEGLGWAAVGGVIGIGIGTFGAWVFKKRGGRPAVRRA